MIRSVWNLKGCVRMSEIRLLVLFGGVSPEHEVSLRSAESILSTLNKTRYRVFPVGITIEGNWLLYQCQDYSRLPRNTWQELSWGKRRGWLHPGPGTAGRDSRCGLRCGSLCHQYG